MFFFFLKKNNINSAVMENIKYEFLLKFLEVE